MAKIKTIIADDEQPARNELAFLLENIAEIELIAQARNGQEVLELIEQQKPDIVFLDIQMPGKTGLEVARELKNSDFNPIVVFITAYDQYAVEAFEVNAVDYLLKPFEEKRIIELIERVKKIYYSDNEMKERLTALLDRMERDNINYSEIGINKLAVQTCRGHLKLLNYNEIVLLYTKNSRVYARTATEEYEVASTLSDLEERLKKHKFLRAHRSYLINLNKVKEIIPWFKGKYQVVMNDNRETEVIISRSKVKELQRIFDL